MFILCSIVYCMHKPCINFVYFFSKAKSAETQAQQGVNPSHYLILP